MEADLKKWFPEAFELEVGKWYKSDAGGKWFIEELRGTQQKSYGFNLMGKWSSSMNRLSTGLIELSLKEVGKALIKEARRRGYREGVLIEDIYTGIKERPNITVSSDDFDWEEIPVGKRAGVMALRDSEGSILFTDGHWTQII